MSFAKMIRAANRTLCSFSCFCLVIIINLILYILYALVLFVVTFSECTKLDTKYERYIDKWGYRDDIGTSYTNSFPNNCVLNSFAFIKIMLLIMFALFIYIISFSVHFTYFRDHESCQPIQLKNLPPHLQAELKWVEEYLYNGE